jgi:outer membrane protein assembly factor BamE (lipoprotein component of BamABCDE complex)
MKSSLRLRLFTLLAATIACAGLPGCLAVHQTDTTISGTKIPPATFAQIEPGKSKEFVVGLLGEPSVKVKMDGGGELWKWRYSETHKDNSGLIFVFMSKNETKVEKTCCVEFTEGVVTKVWSE